MRTFISTTRAMDCPPVGDWADGSQTTMKGVPIKRWATPRRSNGIGWPTVTVASRRSGRPCKCALRVKTPRSSQTPHVQRAASTTNSETELENRPPAAVEKGTPEKRRGRVAKIRNSSLSLFKMIEARRNTDQTETGAASKNASLRNAPSGPNIGVHITRLNPAGEG